MSSALQTAVLGMRAYQEMLNVTGNNIANADTTGFKEDTITFSDMFSRTLSRGMRASEDVGGTNPIQVGLGVRVSQISSNMSQGSFTSTERDFDLAMDGQGFFVVNDGTSNLFTRDGTFDVDAGNYLVDPATGYRVQRIGTTGEDFGFQVAGDNAIRIPFGTELPGSRTREITFQGNLSGSEYNPTTSTLRSTFDYTLLGGGMAEAGSEFADVRQLSDFSEGDTIRIDGRAREGETVEGEFTYGDGDTLQDLLDSITDAFGGPDEVNVYLEDGRIHVRDAQAGYSMLDVRLSSSAHPDAVSTYFDYMEVGGAAAQSTNINVVDRQSRSHAVTMTFVRHGEHENVWDMVVNSVANATDIPNRRIAGITFDENGIYQGISGTDGFDYTSEDRISLDFPGIDSTQDITAYFGREGFYDGLTQMGGESSAGAIDQDGYGTGSLQSVSVDASGRLSGTFTNGETLEVADLQIATFDNPQGLERIGANYYRHTPSAGSTVYSRGLQSRAGAVRQNVLEDSNVDIAREFTRLITAQNGFQVNSRTIRVINTILQQLAAVVT